MQGLTFGRAGTSGSEIKVREKCNVCRKIRLTGNTAKYRISVDLSWKKNSRETGNELRIGGLGRTYNHQMSSSWTDAGKRTEAIEYLIKGL